MNSLSSSAGWYPGRPVRAAAQEAEGSQIKWFDEEVNDADEMVLADPILQPLRQKRCLVAVQTFDET